MLLNISIVYLQSLRSFIIFHDFCFLFFVFRTLFRYCSHQVRLLASVCLFLIIKKIYKLRESFRCKFQCLTYSQLLIKLFTLSRNSESSHYLIFMDMVPFPFARTPNLNSNILYCTQELKQNKNKKIQGTIDGLIASKQTLPVYLTAVRRTSVLPPRDTYAKEI